MMTPHRIPYSQVLRSLATSANKYSPSVYLWILYPQVLYLLDSVVGWICDVEPVLTEADCIEMLDAWLHSIHCLLKIVGTLWRNSQEY